MEYYRPLRDNEILTDVKKGEEQYGRLIVDTKHSFQRYLERYANKKFKDDKGNSFEVTKELVIDKIKRGMKKIINKHNDEVNEYLIHSIKHKLGVVIGWQRPMDKELDFGKNNAVIITFLSIKDSHYKTKPTDVEILVENDETPLYTNNEVLIDQLTDVANEQSYLTEGRYTIPRNQQSSEGGVEIINFKDSNFRIVFFEGKFWDCTAKLVEVE
jgi:hypothetical protein